jgi:L-lactate dehydrogenase (cytochrome)
MPAPIALAPVGAAGLFDRDGEVAAARAAAAAGWAFSVSTLSSVPLEEVAAASRGPLWFSLYVWGDRSTARALVDRAASAGYRALIVTADVAVRSRRERELHAGMALPLPSLSAAALFDAVRHPRWTAGFVTGRRPSFPNLGRRGGEAPLDIGDLFDGTLSWADVEWVRDQWHGPLAVKGILSAADARRAVDAGADAVIVSNHGGRQLDQVPAAISVLPSIVEAVGERVDVLVDSGFRRGTDVAAAVALGARAVLVGRPWCYGLAAAGEAGVAHVLDLLNVELATSMALTGVTTLDDLARATVTIGSDQPAVGW